MKLTNTLGCIALSALFFVSCKQNSNEQSAKENGNDTLKKTEQTTASAQASGIKEKATFQIEGMTCAMGCAKTIEGKLAKLDGVSSAKVDFESKTATVEFDNGKQNPESIKETVEKIANGAYKVENMTSNKESAMVFQEKKQDKKASCCAKDAKKEGKSYGDKEAKNTVSKDKKEGSCCAKDKKSTKTA